MHETRAHYQQLVVEIQHDIATPLAKEVVTWPSKFTLCSPIFTSQDNRDPLQPAMNQVIGAEVADVCLASKKVGGDNLVWKQLPKDRQSLLELRTKLSMELVWLQQAIASRQKVGVVKFSLVIL